MQYYSQLWSWQTVLQAPCESRAAGEAGQPRPQGLSDRGASLGRGNMTLIPFLKKFTATLASPAQRTHSVLHEAIK